MLILQAVDGENIKMFLGIKQTTEDDKEKAGSLYSWQLRKDLKIYKGQSLMNLE